MGRRVDRPSLRRDATAAFRERTKGRAVQRSGMLVTVAVKPGLLQGPIQQELRLKINLAAMPEIGLPIQGIISSNQITLAGHGCEPDTSILTLGRIPRREGLQRRLTLLVPGPSARQVEFKLDHVEPGELRVTVGGRGQPGQGGAVQTP